MSLGQCNEYTENRLIINQISHQSAYCAIKSEDIIPLSSGVDKVGLFSTCDTNSMPAIYLSVLMIGGVEVLLIDEDTPFCIEGDAIPIRTSSDSYHVVTPLSGQGYLEAIPVSINSNP